MKLVNTIFKILALQGKRVLSIFMLLGLGMVLFTGCRPVPVSNTILRKDSVIERERLVPIHVKESFVKSVFTKAQLDSLTDALRSMPRESRNFYYTDPQLKTQLSFTLDSLGRLAITCRTLEQTLFETIKERDRIIQEKELQIVKERETFGQKLSNFMDIAMWIGIVSTVLYLVFNFFIFKRLKP